MASIVEESSISDSSSLSSVTSSSCLDKKPAFKATRIWNDLLDNFKDGVELKRRRYYMKQYDNCFVASEAVDWLHKHLTENPHFGADVSRKQALQLAQKFLENKVFVDVHGCSNQVFEDDSKLYHFLSPKRKTPKRGGLRSSLRAYSSESSIKMTSENNRTGDQSRPVKKALKRKPSFTGLFKSNTFSSLPRIPLGNKGQGNVSTTSDNVSGNSSSIYENAFSLSSESADDTTTYISSNVVVPPVIKSSLDPQTMDSIWRDVIKTRLERLLGLESLEEILDTSYIDGSVIRVNSKITYKEVTQAVPNWLLSAMRCLVKWPNDSEEGRSLPKYPGFEQDVFRAVCDYFDNLEESLVPLHFNSLLEGMSRLMLRCRVLAVRSFQYLLLIIPTPLRNQLHILMRFMCKMSVNQKLSLSKHLPTRELVIQKFTSCIFNIKHTDFSNDVNDDVTAIRLVSFMMENCRDIFKTNEEMETQVNQRIWCLENQTSPPVMNQPPVYCEQLTLQGYQQSKLSNSQNAIKELLENIVKDGKMSDKEKKKNLKQFEKTYPGIYYEKFPQGQVLFPKTKAAEMMKIKSVLKHLR